MSDDPFYKPGLVIPPRVPRPGEWPCFVSLLLPHTHEETCYRARMAETLHPVKTFWKRGGQSCVLYVGSGRFELRLIEERVVRSEACHDSGEAYTKAQQWAHERRDVRNTQ